MSKSLKRVKAALEASKIDHELRELSESTRTAIMAADALGVEQDQIAKSIVVQGQNSDALFLFVTAGGNRVDMEKVSQLLGETTVPAAGTDVRKVTGFAIGGVSPIGHLSPIETFMDPRLLELDDIWAAAGTPRHVFRTKPNDLLLLTNAKVVHFVEGE